jgi:adenylate cyclase
MSGPSQQKRIWWSSFPVVLLFASSFWCYQKSEDLSFDSVLFRERFYPIMQSIQGFHTNAKFKIRGEESVKNKIVIVEIDDRSVFEVGRWPWHRDQTALLVEKALQAGAKLVALDITFSEKDDRVPAGLAETLKYSGVDVDIAAFETDPILTKLIADNPDRVVLGYMAEHPCHPRYSRAEDCPVNDPEIQYPDGFEKFSLANTLYPKGVPLENGSVPHVFNLISNLSDFNEKAKYSGLLNAEVDSDGVIRKTPLFYQARDKLLPVLSLVAAEAVLKQRAQATFDGNGNLKAVSFNGKNIPITAQGQVQMNFRGGRGKFPYLSAVDVLKLGQAGEKRDLATTEGAEAPDETQMPPEKVQSTLKDAVVLVGLSALGAWDMRAFPFDTHTPGVEGHATALDNIISGDLLRTTSMVPGAFELLMALMVLGGILFAWWFERLDSLPALGFFIVIFISILGVDQKVFFDQGINLNTTFLLLEFSVLFMVVVALKYIFEEQNRKFIRGAFARYLAPTVVDYVLKNPEKLTVGGERRELTIMFSDIRSFTTFSEKMDPKTLSSFLNEYLGKMTDVIFKYDGTLDKYIGDAVMAFWGAPLEVPDHAAKAIQTIYEMIEAVHVMQPDFEARFGIKLEVGIGLNTGFVSVGNMGSDKIFEYTVIGDTVNLASRIEGLTKYYGAEIIISRATLESALQVKNFKAPTHRTVDRVKVKGKKDAIEMIEILCRPAPAEGLEAFELGRTHYALLFLERCHEYQQTPPAPDWDGSYEMTSK